MRMVDGRCEWDCRAREHRLIELDYHDRVTTRGQRVRELDRVNLESSKGRCFRGDQEAQAASESLTGDQPAKRR